MSKKYEFGSGTHPDGRRHNRPPEHGKIKPGEIRNKYGRGGKPRFETSRSIDELLQEEAARVVSRDEDGPVDAKRRLVQEEYRAALHDRNPAVRWRLLSQLNQADLRREERQREILDFVTSRKASLSEEFYLAQKMRRPPPDVVPHPDHVMIRDGLVFLIGPTDYAGRERWEFIKSAIRIAACFHEIARAEFRRTSSAAVLADLRSYEKHRRWLMRAVPKGWNWREEIYCRDSTLDFAKENVRFLRETGYVPSTDNN